MRRSDFIEKAISIMSQDGTKDYNDLEDILTVFEKVGMLPPEYVNKGKGGFIISASWEPETKESNS